ncbi:MAG: exo-alpha-sialidase [Phycisphaeraceae bacterium]
MKHDHALLSLMLLLMCSAGSRSAGASEQEGKLAPFLGEPKLEIVDVFKGERFPNVVVTLDGTLIATWGSEHVRAKRSTDAGLTWSEDISIVKGHIHGGGTTVDETTGDILVFTDQGKHPPSKVFMFRSKDDGKTWTQEDTTIHRDRRGGSPSMHMNERGITLRHGKHKGRLIRPSRDYAKANYPKNHFPTHYTNAIYSDDHGKTWHPSDPFPEMGTGEACLVELSDGRIYYNTRRHWAPDDKNPLRRWDAWSSDGGKTWENVGICEVLPDGAQHRSYGCMGGLVRLPIKGKDVLIYSNIVSEKGRQNGHVWASFDGGVTWPIMRQVDAGPFAYSAMTAGRPGTKTQGHIYLHYESQGGSKIARFNLSWVLNGEATGDGEVPTRF